MNQTILKIDKTNWKTVKFGDVVAEPKETCKDIIAEGIEHVVGLENIDTGDLHLRKSATTEESTTFSKKFKKGDVLFGRRRAYLKKAAQADFDGICSGDITVFRPKKELSSALLPFIVNNDKFFDYAVKHSAGGLSPRVKFKDLANYEFLLPPKAEQARLAELLWAMDEVIENEKGVLEKLENAYSVVINQTMIHGNYQVGGNIIQTKCGLLDSRIKLFSLKDCLLEKPTYGANAPSKAYEIDTPRYIRITDIDDEGNLIKEDFVSIDSDDYENYILKHNDFLFARTGNTVGKTLLYDSQMGESVYAGYLIRFRLNQKFLLPKFLFYFTKSLKYESFKRKMTKVGAQPNINSEEYQLMIIPGLPIEMQENIVDKLDSMKLRNNLLKSKISSSQSLQKSLINQIF